MPESVCVLCGEPWEGIKNRCECGGFCTWGPAKGAQPSSWTEDGQPRPVPREEVMPGESCERVAVYVVTVPYYGRPDQSPDESVARAINLSLGTNSLVFKYPDSLDELDTNPLPAIEYEA